MNTPLRLPVRFFAILPYTIGQCRSQQPRGLRLGSTAVRLLGLRVRIPQAYGCLSVASVECCQVEVSAVSRSLVQRRPNQCGFSEFDREASIKRRPWPTRGCRAIKKIFGHYVI